MVRRTACAGPWFIGAQPEYRAVARGEPPLSAASIHRFTDALKPTTTVAS